MDQGTLLKYYRQKNNLSQQEVCRGIVSPSYLSRIENNQLVPAEDTMAQLFERVGMDVSRQNSEIDTVRGLLEQWEDVLLQNQKDDSIRIHQKLDPYITQTMHSNTLEDYHVLAIRHYILMNDVQKAEDSIQATRELTSGLSDRNRFFYWKHTGNLELVKGNTQDAERALTKAIKDYFHPVLHELEKADAYYLLSLAVSKQQKDAVSLEYAKAALEIYQPHYRLEQCARTHIQMGVSYSRSRHFDAALEQLTKAKRLAKALDLPHILGIVEHNLANVYSRLHEPERIIHHLRNSLSYKEGQDAHSYMTTMVFLISIYYRYDHREEAETTWHEAWKRKNSLSRESLQWKELQFYQLFLFEPHEAWEPYITEEFFPYLKESNNQRAIISYARLVADCYKQLSLYKKAAYYFELALDTCEQTKGKE
ncbi:helix-turn-helix domain-containing protein [Salimicrobium halophilum]|uniref:Helix-turn-helix domain-containing protein n=1 Tax=Salimicrobium halophilum TaxID=86666 RepID=A0A1G8R3S9_9BACI|nr:helix-turn-helix transcriptional regulator [Salimicrobium halophilum]SDJ11629.1 Helix-turn-helix domain-containing protein [Salimicrobium halophilum]